MRKNLVKTARASIIPFGFVIMTFAVLEIVLKQEQRDIDQLKRQLTSLEKKIKEAENHRAYLRRQINSQSDPAWIEMVLKKELGLVPENQKKIYFSPS